MGDFYGIDADSKKRKYDLVKWDGEDATLRDRKSGEVITINGSFVTRPDRGQVRMNDFITDLKQFDGIRFLSVSAGLDIVQTESYYLGEYVEVMGPIEGELMIRADQDNLWYPGFTRSLKLSQVTSVVRVGLDYELIIERDGGWGIPLCILIGLGKLGK